MAKISRALVLFYHRLLRMHPAERGRDLWYQEEARAERLSNFIRIVYVLFWLVSTGLHAPGNNFWSNFSNLGMGGLWILWAIFFQIWLLYHPYRKGYKFLSTAIDMVIITMIIWFYQFAAGPVYALKVPTFFNYFCCLGMVALRYKRSLALFGGGLAVLLYLLLYLYFYFTYDLSFGTGIEHTTTNKINAHYVVYQLTYLVVTSFLTYVMAVNVKRLVELRARENQSAQRATERAMVAAGVAHEIKNPLEGIYGAAQLLEEEGKGNPRFIQMILKDSVRLNDVVQRFLRFSRPFEIKLEKVDLVVLIKNFCQAQNELFPDTSVVFTSNLETCPIVSDPEGVLQILRNLVQNAQRYQIPGQPIQIRHETRSELSEIHIEDEGVGVPIDQRGKLFDPFFTTSAQGTGLGLAISRKIAKELGGDLYYEPLEPGSRFTLVLNHRGIQEVELI